MMTNHPVLVLNQSYEPLTVCRARRAVVLIFQGKAEMLENGVGNIHTISETIELPSVIRLGRMVKRPRRQRKMTRYEIFNRDRYTCQYCGAAEPAANAGPRHTALPGRPAYLGKRRQRLRGLQPAQGRPHPQGSQHEAGAPARTAVRRPLFQPAVPLPEQARRVAQIPAAVIIVCHPERSEGSRGGGHDFHNEILRTRFARPRMTY